MIDDMQIIRYLDGEMTEAEKLEFEHKISDHPGLAERVETFRKIQELAGKALRRAEDPEAALDDETREEIRQAVKDFKEGRGGAVSGEDREMIRRARRAFEQRREKARPKEKYVQDGRQLRANMLQIRRIWFTAAAVVVLAVIILLIIFRPLRDRPQGDLYAKYYKEFPLTEKVIELSRADDDLLFALRVYEAGDYERALILFEMLADSSDLRQYSLFYAAHAYLHLNLTDRAIKTFLDLLDEGPGELETATRWYLALSYLRSGEEALSKEQLKQVAATDSPYRKDARRLLADLQ
jgi:tetratricopeptide (TPR) repeat protein